MKFIYYFVIGIIILLIGFGLYFYFTKEKVVENNQVIYTNINIATLLNDKQVSTGFIVSRNIVNDNFFNGTTQKAGFVLVKVPINSSYYIRNYNLVNQTYHTSIRKIDIFTQEPQRVNLELVLNGTLKIKEISNINNSVNLSLTSVGEFRNPTMCLISSTNIINVYTSLSQIEKDKNYLNWDKCFILNSFKDNENQNVNINYITFGRVSSLDTIKLVFFDKDVYEGIENTNWKNEVTYQINNINNI